MSEPRTPQVPMVDQNGQPFYPLTQYNQIVMPGGERWDGNPGSSVELDETLKEAGKAADAAAVGAAVNELKNEKANNSDLAAVAKSGSYNDLSDKPTIPSVPSALPNPHALTINGMSYDGSKAVDMTVSGLPNGGTAGQVLTKASDTNQDAKWGDPPGGISIETIWVNGAPTSQFGAVTLTENSGLSKPISQFDGCSIFFKNQSNGSYYVSTGFFPKGNGFALIYLTSDGQSYRRKGSITEAGVVFENGSLGATSSSDACIPLIIYGWRGVG